MNWVDKYAPRIAVSIIILFKMAGIYAIVRKPITLILEPVLLVFLMALSSFYIAMIFPIRTYRQSIKSGTGRYCAYFTLISSLITVYIILSSVIKFGLGTYQYSYGGLLLIEVSINISMLSFVLYNINKIRQESRIDLVKSIIDS